MKPNNTLLYAALAATVLASGLALASADEAREYYQLRGPIPFEAFDRDGDGKLTAEEFNDFRSARHAWRSQQGYPLRHAAAAPPFASIDRNNDGVISPEEHAAHHQARMQQRMLRGPRCAGNGPAR